jgi:hypothetical protein
MAEFGKLAPFIVGNRTKNTGYTKTSLKGKQGKWLTWCFDIRLS